MLSIDKELLENRTGMGVSKYTREGVIITDRKTMLMQYFATCSSIPEIVVLGIDPWLFSGEGLSRNSYKLFLPFLNQPEVKDYVSASVKSKSELLRAEIIKSTRFNALLLNASIRGYLKNWDNLKFGVVDSVRIRKEISESNFRRITFIKELIEDFSKVLDYLAEKDTKVILLNTPIWGPMVNAQPEEYLRSIRVIDSLRVIHCPSADLVDLVPRFSGSTRYFFDPIHLNPDGQNAVTEYFAEVVNVVYNQKRSTNTATNGKISDE
jgi:hypothetical protein